MTKNGMLPIPLASAIVDILMKDAWDEKNVTVDLCNQFIVRWNGEQIPFEIDPRRKESLIGGLDDIAMTLAHLEEIKKYEIQRFDRGWIDGRRRRVDGVSKAGELEW
jgi:3-isopropylmalate dehydratase small subunit